MTENAPQLSVKKMWLIAFSIMLPTAFAMLATSATNVAIPHIAGAFGATIDETNWVITSYMISNAVLLPLTGWLENLLGRIKFINIFIIIFTIGSLLCAIATNLDLLILGRVIQGIGGGPLMPIAQAILLQAFPYEKRGHAMAVFAFAVMISSILGPTFGGFIVDNSSWQWIFLANIPVGIISIFLVKMNIPELRERKIPEKVDVIGLTALITWLFSMQVVLDKGQQFGWFDTTWICWLSGVSFFAFIFFIVWELEYEHAIVDLRVLKNFNFIVGTTLGGFINMILYITILLLPMFLQGSMGYTAYISGLSLAPRAISCIIMLPIVGTLVNIVDNRLLIAAGFSLLGISTFMYTNINLSVSFIYVALPNILLGAGVILTFIPVAALALGTLPKSQISNGAGLHSLTKCVLTSISVSLSSALVSRFSQFHQTYLIKNLSIYNNIFLHRSSLLLAKLTNIYAPYLAEKKTNLILYKQVLQQSKLIAFVDIFQIFALVAFLLIPLAFLLKCERKPA